MSEELIMSTVSEEYKLNNELRKIKRWFVDNDWKPNKIVTGEWSTNDPRWISYCEERAIKRARQDEIIAMISNREESSK